MAEDAAAGLDPFGFARRFHGDADHDRFVRGHFVQVNVQHPSTQRMVLDLLHQGQPGRGRVVLHREVHEDVLGCRVMDEVLEFLCVELEILGLALAAVHDRGNAPGGAQFFDAAAAHQRARKGI
ncbi:MAG: hypothetical protein BWX84_01487 [Verrucomicrobia bacterium ADurb.Bin118]|nr:MAG: hypothetical protein BWX84_01487 [Verrucomicrobia bacterium ADurb.Bin118]